VSKSGAHVKEFFNAIQTNQKSSLYTLCNLLLKQDSSVVNLIKKKISAEQLKKIINCMLMLEQDNWYLLDQDRLRSFLQFKVLLMTDKHWCKHLDLDDIVTLSNSDEFVLMGLIALTRKHHMLVGHDDLFKHFDFSLLQKTGASQSIGIIAERLQLCQSLPLEYFKRLGQDKIDRARLILLYLQEHPSRFEMGVFFLQHHPMLKNELQANWLQTKESLALPEASAILLNTCAMEVSETYPEFQRISSTIRAKRDIPDSSEYAYSPSYAHNVFSHIRALGFNHQTLRFIAMGAVSFSISPILSLTSPLALYTFGVGLWTIRAAVTPIEEEPEIMQTRKSPASNA
tara:strand:+ start:66119 stop:67147 length:1029 start_codon:yes stop_codon:yes gene_type:complete